MAGSEDKRKRRRVRLSEGPSVPDWQSKVHPFFVKVSQQQKTINQLSRGSGEERKESQRLIRNPSAELKEEAERIGDEFRRAGKPCTVSVLALFGVDPALGPEPEISHENYMLAWIAWNRYRKTFKQLLEEDLAAVRQSSRRVLEVHRDYQRWRYGELQPEDMRFKTDLDHQALIICGWDFGIESLSPEELAACFDELCSCGKEHDPENMRKFRARLLRFLEAAGVAVQST